MEKLVCSLCGYESPQRKFKFPEINEHFDRAVQVWCPLNKCKKENKDKRVSPAGCYTTWWYDYGGWSTVEKISDIDDFELYVGFKRAKLIQEYGLEMLKKQKEDKNKNVFVDFKNKP